MNARNRSTTRKPTREPMLESLGDDTLAAVSGGAGPADLSIVKRSDKASNSLLVGGPREVAMMPAIRF